MGLGFSGWGVRVEGFWVLRFLGLGFLGLGFWVWVLGLGLGV